MTAQLKLRTFTVVEAAPTPSIAPSVTPLSNGCAIATGPLTAEQRAAGQLATYRPNREADAYTRLKPAQGVTLAETRRDVMRGRLLGMSKRDGDTAWTIAGLYRDHGGEARRVLAAAWRPDCGVAKVRIDALLARAGVML